MSMVFVGVDPGAIVFAGDGVATEPVSGNVVGLVSKLVLMPELPCILGFTGMAGAGRFFAYATEGKYVDFDSLLEGVVDDCREIHERALEELNLPHASYAKMCIALGGWSDLRQQYEAYRCMSYPKESLVPGETEVTIIPPWTLSRIEFMWASSAPTTATMARLGANDCDDLLEAAVRWICAGRQDCGRDENGLLVAIGGYVQIAVLDDNGVRSWIPHRWPEDEIGRPLDPNRGLQLPQWLERADGGVIGA